MRTHREEEEERAAVDDLRSTRGVAETRSETGSPSWKSSLMWTRSRSWKTLSFLRRRAEMASSREEDEGADEDEGVLHRVFCRLRAVLGLVPRHVRSQAAGDIPSKLQI